MVRTFVLVLLATLALPAQAEPKTLPPHMSGLGVFTYKSSVGNTEGEQAKAYAKAVHDAGYHFVIVKSHDGGSWGTRVGRTWREAISRDLIAAFHGEGMRVYSYFTARLKTDTSVDESIQLAVRTLEMGADGVVVDDLGLFGKSKARWERLFAQLRKQVDARPWTILAFSSFPHLMQWKDVPWAVALKYADFFLPQSYWKLFRDMSPQNALAYTQGQFDALRAYHPGHECTLVPVGMTYGKSVSATQITRFLQAAAPYYKGVALFLYEQMPKGGAKAIEGQHSAYDPNRTVQNISLVDLFNGKTKPSADATPPTAPSKPGKTDKPGKPKGKVKDKPMAKTEDKKPAGHWPFSR
ncbi:hypothetical protein HZA85_02675 [Candidatus Uhrbacteria bacterium]|nr:hypothetical protein [Candidatus Uhrbacteria bacterium]